MFSNLGSPDSAILTEITTKNVKAVSASKKGHNLPSVEILQEVRNVQRFVTSSPNTGAHFFSYKRSFICLAYFDQKKCMLRQKLIVFSLLCKSTFYRNCNFVCIFLPIRILKEVRNVQTYNYDMPSTIKTFVLSLFLDRLGRPDSTKMLYYFF